MSPSAQVTVTPSDEQPAPEVNVALAGSGIETTADDAVAVPLFLTVAV